MICSLDLDKEYKNYFYTLANSKTTGVPGLLLRCSSSSKGIKKSNGHSKLKLHNL